MNILHISTSLNGGAAVAALKVHNDLLAQGIKSKFLYLTGEAGTSSHRELYKYAGKRGKYHWKYYTSRIYVKLASLLNRSIGDYEMFSYPYSQYDLSTEPLVKEADILHLHWVAGFIDYPTFFEKIRKPIVWTLHDMNPFLGGFHYEDDDLFNESKALRQVDTSIKALKNAVFQHTKNITVVAPSQWLLDTSKRSAAFAQFPHYHVPYSIDPSEFRMFPKAMAREQLGLAKDEIVFTFLSDRLNNKRKGFEILIESIRLLLNETAFDKLTIINIGAGTCDIKGARNMGKISNRSKIAQILSASDSLLLPSREDNFPNVMMEANACGCPVIAFPVGGIKEFVLNSFNGMLAETVDAYSLKEVMKVFITKRPFFDNEAIRKHIINAYSPTIQANSYIEIYKRILAMNKPIT